MQTTSFTQLDQSELVKAIDAVQKVQGLSCLKLDLYEINETDAVLLIKDKQVDIKISEVPDYIKALRQQNILSKVYVSYYTKQEYDLLLAKLLTLGVVKYSTMAGQIV